MAVLCLYGRPKDEDEVITKLPPVRNIVVVLSPFRVVPIALDSYRCDLHASVVVFHVK